MRRIYQGTLVTIEAMHEFSRVYDQRVFCGGSYQEDQNAACKWGVERAEQLREKYAAEDPRNADIISFVPTHIPVQCEVKQ